MKRTLLLALIVLSPTTKAQQELPADTAYCLLRGDAAYKVQAFRNTVPGDDYALFEFNANQEWAESEGKHFTLSVAKDVFNAVPATLSPDKVHDLVIDACLEQNHRIKTGQDKLL